jgi:hypothetical protein
MQKDANEPSQGRIFFASLVILVVRVDIYKRISKTSKSMGFAVT